MRRPDCSGAQALWRRNGVCLRQGRADRRATTEAHSKLNLIMRGAVADMVDASSRTEAGLPDRRPGSIMQSSSWTSAGRQLAGTSAPSPSRLPTAAARSSRCRYWRPTTITAGIGAAPLSPLACDHRQRAECRQSPGRPFHRRRQRVAAVERSSASMKFAPGIAPSDAGAREMPGGASRALEGVKPEDPSRRQPWVMSGQRPPRLADQGRQRATACPCLHRRGTARPDFGDT